MSKVKAVLDFYKNTLPKKAVELADLCEEIGLLTFSGEYAGKVVANAGLTAVYADHVAAELQAENAALRAKVAELEAGREWLPIEKMPKSGEFLLGVWSGDWRNPKQRFTVFHATGYKDGASWAMKGNYRTEEGGAYSLAGWMPLPKGIAK